MRSSKAILFLIILPLLVGLACLQPVAPTATPTPAPITRSITLPATDVVRIVPATPTRVAPACARITADEALHLRQDPDPHARVLAFMRSGEVVRLLSARNASWWLVQRDGVIGYARSRYLASAHCEGEEE